MQEELYIIKNFFPVDDEEIEDYLLKLFSTINLNYNNEEYQFAYVALHLVFMTYLYNLVWQISKLNEEKYQIASLFSRPFNGSNFDFNNITSVFDFKNLPEKEVINYLFLIGLDKSYIGILKSQIEKRNSMSHASGTYDIIDINSFTPEKDTIVSIISKCSEKFNENLLRNYYVKSIVEWIDNDTMDHNDFEFFIDEFLIVNISVSQMN